MKKTANQITLIFAAITTVLAFLTPILTEDKDLSSWIIPVFLSFAAIGIWAFPAFAKNKMLTVIPVAVLTVVSTRMQSMTDAVSSAISEDTGVALPGLYDFETLSLVLAIAFVVAMVFAFKKGCKWAITTSVIYSALMLANQTQLFLNYEMGVSAVISDTKDLITLLSVALAFVTAYAAQVAMFAGIESETAAN